MTSPCWGRLLPSPNSKCHRPLILLKHLVNQRTPFTLAVHKAGTATANKQVESAEGPVSISGLIDVRRMLTASRAGGERKLAGEDDAESPKVAGRQWEGDRKLNHL